MNLKQYMEQTTQADFARLIGVSSGMVYQWLNDLRPVSAELCVVIEKETQGAVTRKDLRPDDWQKIWPELSRKKAA